MAETALTIKEIIKERTPVPLYIWGEPGIGKSDIVKQAGIELDCQVVDIRLSLMDPTDLRGIPMIVDGVAQWIKPSFLPSLEGSIMFFDELNHAPPSVQSSAYQIILDGKIGEHTLPPNTMRIAAGNPRGAGMLGHEIPLPLKNRFVHINMRHDQKAWVSWAEDSGVDSRVISFIKSKPEQLMMMPSSEAISNTYGFPTPRSWFFVSEIIKDKTHSRHKKMLLPMVEGAVGGRTGAAFTTFLHMLEEYKSPEYILDHPEYIDKSTDKSVIWSVLTSIAQIVTKDKAQNFSDLLNNPCIPSELSAYVIKLAVSNHNKHFLFEGDLVSRFIGKEEVKLLMEHKECHS